MPPRTAGELRGAFCDFFAARGHTVVPSASLVPNDPTVLFTVAGMVPFKGYFVGEEVPPFSRAVSVQRCVRAGGKHNDLDDIGRTNRHFSFFEMLGNFSFGDYFKTEAITWAWEFVTQTLGLDPERLWVTVHTSDDEAFEIWTRQVGVPEARVQRLDEDNFWRMGDTGPCGPSSEIFWDLGAGPPGGDGPGGEGPDGGGPAGDDPDRYIEMWNLVFMAFDERVDGRAVLARPSVDTGAGLERMLMALQGVDSIFDIDIFVPLVKAAEGATGVTYGRDPEHDVSLRILAEHARTMTFLVNDGIVPSNEERGYVLRRIIRRAVRHAYRLSVRDVLTPTLVHATVQVMGAAYPEIAGKEDEIVATVGREEERFRQTLERGLELLESILEAQRDVSGKDAFFLHDTLGFPIDLTREIAQERGRHVDLEGFGEHMGRQRARAQEAHRAGANAGAEVSTAYRELLEEAGPTEFTGRREYTTNGARVCGLVVDGRRVGQVTSGPVEVVLDRTPFYAESGGQVGDTGSLQTESARLDVLDTRAVPGELVVHSCEVREGSIAEGDEVTASIDGARRDRIRRNHTATHVVHWALREVLGSHVKQAGSLVAPDRLRFDFSHFEAVSPEQLEAVEALANAEVITDTPVRHYETTREHAEQLGAIAFFGDKYGDLVRVLEAGDHSVELCGGTHVHALGFIGPIKIVSEGSIGANLRRIEAVTGDVALEHIRSEERALRRAADLLRVKPQEIPERVELLVDEVRALRGEAEAARRAIATQHAHQLVAGARNGVIVERLDGPTGDELRELALAATEVLRSGVVALFGVAAGAATATVVVSVSRDLVDQGAHAGTIAGAAAQVLEGGAGKQANLSMGGGPRTESLEEAGAALAEAAHAAVQALEGGAG